MYYLFIIRSNNSDYYIYIIIYSVKYYSVVYLNYNSMRSINIHIFQPQLSSIYVNYVPVYFRQFTSHSIFYQTSVDSISGNFEIWIYQSGSVSVIFYIHIFTTAELKFYADYNMKLFLPYSSCQSTILQSVRGYSPYLLVYIFLLI